MQGLNIEIETLEKEIGESKAGAEKNLGAAEEPKKKADALDPIIDAGRQRLAVARKAAIKAEDEVVLLRGQNALLEEALQLRKEELSAKSAAIAFYQMTVTKYEAVSELQEEKYTALKRGKRAEKRKRIAVQVVTHAAAIGLGYGFGRIQN